MKIYSSDKHHLFFTCPEKWKVEEDEKIVSVYQSAGGVGALQFSTHLIPTADDLSVKKLLQEFIGDKANEAEFNPLNGYAHSKYLDAASKKYWRYYLCPSIQREIPIGANEHNLYKLLIYNIIINPKGILISNIFVENQK